MEKKTETVYCCESCGAEVPNAKPATCPMCGTGRPQWTDYERDVPVSVDNEFTKKYDKVVEKLQEYAEGTEPESLKYAFED